MTRPVLAAMLLLAFGFSARADLEVFARRDTIVLEDGTEIACRVLMITTKGVLIVVPDPEDKEKKLQRIIPREDIRSIIRDERNGAIEGLSTETELARKVIKGVAHKEDKDKEGGGEFAENSKSGSKGKEKPSPFAAKDKAGPGPLAANETGAPKSTGPVPANAPAKDVKIEMPAGTLSSQDLTDAYFARFPELKSVGLDLLGQSQLQAWIDSARAGSETSRKPLEAVLKTYMGVNEKESRTGTGLRPAKSALNNPNADRPLRRTIKDADGE